MMMMMFGIETTAFSDSFACCVCKYCDQSRHASLTDKRRQGERERNLCSALRSMQQIKNKLINIFRTILFLLCCCPAIYLYLPSFFGQFTHEIIQSSQSAVCLGSARAYTRRELFWLFILSVRHGALVPISTDNLAKLLRCLYLLF